MSMIPVYEESEITTALQILLEIRDDNSASKAKYNALNLAMDAISNKTVPVATEINGETSDGYHTFNELYHHRAVLFAFLVAHYPELRYFVTTKAHWEGFSDTIIRNLKRKQVAHTTIEGLGGIVEL